MSQPQQVPLVVVCWILDPGSYKPPGASVVWGESSCGELSGLHIEAPKALRMKKRADWKIAHNHEVILHQQQFEATDLSYLKFFFTVSWTEGRSKSRHILGLCVVWETGLTSNRMTLEQITQLQVKANGVSFPETCSVWIVSPSLCNFSCCVFSIGTLSANNTTQKYCKSKWGA